MGLQPATITGLAIVGTIAANLAYVAVDRASDRASSVHDPWGEDNPHKALVIPEIAAVGSTVGAAAIAIARGGSLGPSGTALLAGGLSGALVAAIAGPALFAAMTHQSSVGPF